MRHSNYFPRDDKERIVWLNNFIEKLQRYATDLGYTPQDAIILEQELQKFRAVLRVKIEFIPSKSVYGEHGPALPNSQGGELSRTSRVSGEVPSVYYKKLAKTVKDIKNSVVYSPDLGIEFGIIRADRDSQTQVPTHADGASSLFIGGYNPDSFL